MNSATSDREWHKTPQIQNYPSSLEYPQTYSNSIHPPVSSNFISNGKSPELDPRLPGMVALSQPGTPRPSNNDNVTSPTAITSRKLSTSYTIGAFHSTPYPTLNRKRDRNEHFSTELGPFFSSTKPANNLFALDRSTLLTSHIQAKMDRGFFLADNDWTCYRRNYFQVSSSFSIYGLNHYYSDHETHCLTQENGVFYPVLGFSMNISARVSNSDKKIDLVQHTPKRDKGPQTIPLPRPIMPGGNLGMSSVSANQGIATFERIQFKTATANNGKRRAAQQYYVCLIDLYAEVEGNRRIKIASCQSAPLVVRGRSPGHYSDNRDRFDQHLAPPPQQPHSDDNDSRYLAPCPRPPMTPPSVIGGPDYYSPYQYPPYPTSTNYSHLTGMMPPTPTGNPPSNGNNYIVSGMSDPSSSETSSPDLYNDEFQKGSGPGSHNQHGGLHEEADKPSNMNPYHLPKTPYEQPQNSYFPSSSSSYSPYGQPRKYSSTS